MNCRKRKMLGSHNLKTSSNLARRVINWTGAKEVRPAETSRTDAPGNLVDSKNGPARFSGAFGD